MSESYNPASRRAHARSLLEVSGVEVRLVLRNGRELYATVTTPLPRGCGEDFTVRPWGATAQRHMRLADVRRADLAHEKWAQAQRIAREQRAQDGAR